MARKSKSVYERIEDTKQEILDTEQELAELKCNLNALYEERDDLEMKQLFEFIRQNNISFEEAKAIMTKTA